MDRCTFHLRHLKGLTMTKGGHDLIALGADPAHSDGVCVHERTKARLDEWMTLVFSHILIL